MYIAVLSCMCMYTLYMYISMSAYSRSSPFSMKRYRAKPSAQLPKHMHNIIALLLSSDNRSSLQIKTVKAMAITYA